MKLISKEEAIKLALKKYFTGIKCNNDHLSERYVSDGKCTSCISRRGNKYWKIRKKDLNISDQIPDPEIKKLSDKIKELKLLNIETSKLEVLIKKKRNKRNKIVHNKFLETYTPTADQIKRHYEAQKRHYKNNLEARKKRRKWVNNYLKEKKEKDPIFKIIRNFRSRIPKILKRRNVSKKNSMLKILGCTATEFKIHLEKQFKLGMNWDNYGTEWHVDHIIPYDTAKTIDEVEKLTHYSNQQPLWAIENLKKSKKVIKSGKQMGTK